MAERAYWKLWASTAGGLWWERSRKFGGAIGLAIGSTVIGAAIHLRWGEQFQLLASDIGSPAAEILILAIYGVAGASLCIGFSFVWDLVRTPAQIHAGQQDTINEQTSILEQYGNRKIQDATERYIAELDKWGDECGDLTNCILSLSLANTHLHKRSDYNGVLKILETEDWMAPTIFKFVDPVDFFSIARKRRYQTGARGKWNGLLKQMTRELFLEETGASLIEDAEEAGRLDQVLLKFGMDNKGDKAVLRDILRTADDDQSSEPSDS